MLVYDEKTATFVERSFRTYEDHNGNCVVVGMPGLSCLALPDQDGEPFEVWYEGDACTTSQFFQAFRKAYNAHCMAIL